MLRGTLWHGTRLRRRCREAEKEGGRRRKRRKREREIDWARASKRRRLCLFQSLLSLFFRRCVIHPNLCSPMYPIPPVTKTLGMAGVSLGGEKRQKRGETGTQQERKKKRYREFLSNRFDCYSLLLASEEEAKKNWGSIKKRFSDTRCSLACLVSGLLFSTPARFSLSPDTPRSNSSAFRAAFERLSSKTRKWHPTPPSRASRAQRPGWLPLSLPIL